MQSLLNRIPSLLRLTVLGVLVTLVSPACNEILDLEPEQELPAEIALNTFDKVEQAVAGMYGPLGTGSLYGSNLYRIPELMADNMAVTRGGYPNDPYVLRATNIFTGGNRDVWGTAYRVIRNANVIIDHITAGRAVAGADQDDRDRWLGEAYAIRGLMYFELVRLWGQAWPNSNNGETPGVVLRTAVVSNNELLDRAPRSSVGATYNLIIADLTTAADLLPPLADVPNRGRLTQQAAQGLLAEVYFSQNNYQLAYDNARLALTGVTAPLAPLGVFRNNGTATPVGGVIWQLIDADNGWGGESGPNPGAPTDLSINETGPGNIATALTATADDVRGTTLLQSISIDGEAFLYQNKYVPDINYNIPMVRAAEMHLIIAESGAQLGGAATTVAQASYDLVRAASVPSHTPTALTGQSLVTAVRAERRLELAFEGDRYHELRRTGQSVRGLPANSPELLLKIPDIEIGINPDMVQN